MKKTLATIALCLGLSSINPFNANAGLESLTTNTYAIKSSTTGEINVPFDIGKKYAEKVMLLANIAKVFGYSPYSVKEESKNKFMFYSAGGNSEFELIEDTCTSNTFRKGIGVVGSRPSFGDFSAYLVIDFKSNSVGNINYDSKMYTVLKTGFFNAILRNLASIPVIGYPVRSFFEKEQDEVIRMINIIAEKVFKKPSEALETMESYTNGVSFTKEDIDFVRKSLIENGFLEEGR